MTKKKLPSLKFFPLRHDESEDFFFKIFLLILSVFWFILCFGIASSDSDPELELYF